MRGATALAKGGGGLTTAMGPPCQQICGRWEMPTTGFTEKLTTPAFTTVKAQLLEHEKYQQPMSMAKISILMHLL